MGVFFVEGAVTGPKWHTPVMLGKKGDEAVLGSLTLAESGLVLNPFIRRLQRARPRLAQQICIDHTCSALWVASTG
jgi:hypothetical protein